MHWIGRSFWLTPDQPAYLALLALLPLLVFFSYRSLAGLGPFRRGLALTLRCAVVALFACALAGFNSVHEIDDQTAVFVLDTSASLSPDLQQRGFDFARKSTDAMRKGKDRAALITFNGSPSVAQLASHELRAVRPDAAPRPKETNIADAIRLATVILPPDTARRLVLLSDGNQNAGDAMTEADKLRAFGIPVDVVPLSYTHEHEVIFERLSAPATAKLQDTINLSAVLRATRPVRGRVRIYHNDAQLSLGADGSLSSYPVELEVGPNRLTIPVPLREAGAHRFRAVFEPDSVADDTIVQNNEVQAFTVVGGRELVLLIGGLSGDRRPDERDSVQLLADALGREGIESHVRGVAALNLDAAALMAYSCVVLSNVSAIELSPDGQAALASYVRDLGGGLIALGGDQAFSMGGYFRTPLEDVLPVETDRQKLTFLSLAMTIVLDRSGSMAGEKLEMAKSAAVGAVQLLSPHDRIGVVAFDSAADWVVPLQLCENKNAIQTRLRQIGLGGGTDMYPALDQAANALQAANTNLRHVILLTDGRSEPGDFNGLVKRMSSAGITVSAIAIGSDADRNLLGGLAAQSGGRLYLTESAKPLPQIFARETILAGRSGMFERQFTPSLRSSLDSAIVAGFQPSDLPPLAGHVITAAKPLAQVPIVRVTESGADPVLAHWQVGLGRTVAFTSGMWPRWGPQWTSWPGFSKFWSQAVRWASRPANSADFDARIAIDGDRATLTIDAPPQRNADHVGVQLDGQVVDPEFRAHALTLRQTGPNRFESSFPLREYGNYIVRVAFPANHGKSRQAGLLQAGVSHSYSAEWRDLGSNAALLADVARRTQGRLLGLDQAEAVYEPWSIRPIQSRRPLWEGFVRLATALFLLDVAVRRIAVTPADAARRFRRFISELAGTPATTATQTVTTLRGVRDRTRDSIDSQQEAAPPVRAAQPPRASTTTDELRAMLNPRANAPSANERVDARSATDRANAPSANQRADAPSTNQRADAPSTNQRADAPSTNQRADAPSTNQRADAPSTNQRADSTSANDSPDHPPHPAAPVEPADYAGRLLRAKRRARNERKEP